ncbi:hypothetical protein CI594_11165, partial [Fischerella thermalis CCMEE 5196]
FQDYLFHHKVTKTPRETLTEIEAGESLLIIQVFGMRQTYFIVKKYYKQISIIIQKTSQNSRG